MPVAPALGLGDSYDPLPAWSAVPKTLVHKRHAAQVLLTGWSRTSADRYQIKASWPMDDPFYVVRDRLHDPLLMVETVRQSFPLLCHAAYEVPFGHHLVWEYFRYALAPSSLHADGPDAEVLLEIEVQEAQQRRERLSALTLAITLYRGGEPLGTANTRFTVQAPAVYQRLRAGGGGDAAAMFRAGPVATPVPAETVGRPHPDDVLLARAPGSGPGSDPATGSWLLRAKTDHPYLFDHPVDHVPGAVLIDAARQAAGAAAGDAALAAAMDCEFTRYVEFDQPCRITATALPRDEAQRRRFVVEFQQTLPSSPSASSSPACSVVVTVCPAGAGGSAD